MGHKPKDAKSDGDSLIRNRMALASNFSGSKTGKSMNANNNCIALNKLAKEAKPIPQKRPVPKSQVQVIVQKLRLSARVSHCPPRTTWGVL